MKWVIQVQILDKAVCISHSTNTLIKLSLKIDLFGNFCYLNYNFGYKNKMATFKMLVGCILLHINHCICLIPNPLYTCQIGFVNKVFK